MCQLRMRLTLTSTDIQCLRVVDGFTSVSGMTVREVCEPVKELGKLYQPADDFEE